MGVWRGSFFTVEQPTTWLGVVCVVALFFDIVLPSPQRPTKLAQTATEILYIEDGYADHRTYKLEDFFWTGSGDGAPENPWDESDKMSTIYKTKTVMSTIYISVNDNNQTNTEIQTPSECVIDCETVSTPEGEIRPTPTYENHTTLPSIPDHGEKGNATADRHFWLLTVIKTDGQEPMVAVLEKRLAKLYSVAFRRQQERHLGIAKRPKRDLSNNNNKNLPENKPVNVCIHTIAKNEDTNEVEVLYHVLVSGKPVAAITAASDMRFVSDEEVANELGFPIRTKAEPYLKMERPQSLARVRDTWIFVGVALATIFLLLFMVTLFTLCLNKKKRTNLPVRPIGITNRQHIFEREAGHDNNGFVEGTGDNTKTYVSGRRYHRGTPHRKGTASNESLTSRLPLSRPQSSQSSITTTSSSSSDVSPLMLPPKHKTHTVSHSRIQKKLRQNDKRVAAINKTLLLQKHASVGIESDSSSDKHGSETTLVKDTESRGKISPKSYLSMPSVKSFPKSSIPETLNKVLEPVSVLHLDMTDDVQTEPSPIMYRPVSGKKFIRHGSMGCEDPGVIGPVVWDLHSKRLKHDEEIKSENHANRMRKRFNELLDDTFSLFGTSKEDAEPGTTATSTKSGERGHSAIIRPSTGNSPVPKPRPKTSDPRRVAPSPGLEPPRGAWASTTPSPLIRPLSAGPFHKPSIEMERILADGTLPVSDPAVPLIAAIKTELEKCSLPGSTTNLVAEK